MNKWSGFLAGLESSKPIKRKVPIIKRISFTDRKPNDHYYMVYSYTKELWFIIYHTWKGNDWVRSNWTPESWVNEYNKNPLPYKKAFYEEVGQLDLPEYLGLPEWE